MILDNRPLISIIVPIYNTETYLNKCVDSILNQSYENLEVILVNDGSTDNCLNICNDYAKRDKRVKVIDKMNGGLSSARNSALKMAQGDYIGFVDSDDYIERDMYENLIKGCIQNNSDVSNIMYYYVDENGNKSKSAVIHNSDVFICNEEFLRELLLSIGDVSVCTKLFRKDVIAGLLFDEGKNNEDFLFMLKVIERISGIAFVGKCGYNYLKRTGSISNSGFSKTIIDMVENSVIALELVNKKHPNLIKEAERFLLCQHMSYILLIPYKNMNELNAHYINILNHIRFYISRNIFNSNLKLKEKVILAMMSTSPKFVKWLRDSRRRAL